jgi:micrococcal nuclease
MAASALAAGCGSSEDGATTDVDSAPAGTAVATGPTGSGPTGSGPVDDADALRASAVVDGDTLHVAAGDDTVTVRLIGINTPESGECFGEEATDALAALVGTEPLRLLTDTSDLDQFGRALRYVEVDGRDVGAALVEGGFAIARRYEPDVARHAAYAALQEEARSARRGLWASDACGTAALGGSPVEIQIEVEPDPPGDDLAGTSGEWVRFTNTGPAPIDLDGWEVADESASNRYRIGDVALAAGASITLYTGCGSDTDIELFWCSAGSAVWNNGGDTVFLRDPDGNIAASHTYGGG